jgi:hypothetical protein
LDRTPAPKVTIVYAGGSGLVLRTRRVLDPKEDKKEVGEDAPAPKELGMKGKADVVVGEGLT